MRRRLPVGAETRADGRTHFRVWAPAVTRVELVIPAAPVRLPLDPQGDGYHAGSAAAPPGTRYGYSLAGGPVRPDPASRYQPEGPHGLSEVVDPDAYEWRDADWRGPAAGRQVIYETHIGTLTPKGTWRAAMTRLGDLHELGITLLEVMPVAAFPGRFGWGYDGVDLFAPTQLYGTPDDFRAFVDAAHALGMAVILDVVYNHFGPDGCYLREYSAHYFSARRTEWGDALNFDGPHHEPVREYILTNASYWIREYHLDGLRLDATQSMFDRSRPHIVAEVAAAVRAAAAGRRTFVIAENEPQEADLLRDPADGGCGLDAVWNDDFHHTARVALTGRHDAYYSDYRGTPQELISAVRRGYLYQGQHYRWQKQRRGTPALDLETRSFINFLQNHDQVANSAGGERIHALTSPALLRAMTALLLLAPGSPLLLQGQEFAACSPFLYFADHQRELARRVAAGRREFLAQFPGIATPAVQGALADPGAEATFRRCVLDWADRERNAPVLRLHRDLIALAGTEPFRGASRATLEGAVLAPECLLLRYLGAEREDRLLIVNLGRDLELVPLPEPLLAPPAGREWHVAWSSEDPAYGGGGAPDDVESAPAWRIPGRAALVLAPRQTTTEAEEEEEEA